MALTTQSIVKAALDVLNAEGLDSVTTRRLAKALGVQGPALYKHVHSKKELLGLMVTSMFADGLSRLQPSASWQDWLRQLGNNFRSSMLCYRDSALMVAAAWPAEPMRQDIVPPLNEPMIAAGFCANDASFVFSMIAAFVLGHVLTEQSDPQLSFLLRGGRPDIEASFNQQLEIIIAGVASRLTHTRGA